MTTLEAEAARYLKRGPVITLDCNEHSVLQDLEQRSLDPIILESRASVAHALKTRGFHIYRIPQTSFPTLTSISSILMGEGIIEHDDTQILKLLDVASKSITATGLIVLAFPNNGKRNAISFATLASATLGDEYLVTTAIYRDHVSLVLVRKKARRLCHVRWEGSQDVANDGSIAHVNKEFCERLLGIRSSLLITSSSEIRKISLEEQREVYKKLVLPPDIMIRHSWPANFRSSKSHYTIHMQPWEYGALPIHWRNGLPHIDEVWSYTNYVATMYAESGFPQERIRIMPLGYDPDIFNTTPRLHCRFSLPVNSCIFSFVGGLIRRKGSDLAIKAFCRAFTLEDHVCLVIKASGTGSFYARREELDVFAPFHDRPNAPRHVIVNDYLAPTEVAALYQQSTALLCPFRGEGFGLPALEAMACGTPIVYSQGGAMDDFIPQALGYPILTHRRSIHKNFVDGIELVGDGWFLEPDIDSLTQRLREIYQDQQTAHNKGQEAARMVRASYTWDHSALQARERLEEIAASLGISP